MNTKLIHSVSLAAVMLALAPWGAAQTDAIHNITVARHVNNSDGSAASKFLASTNLLKNNDGSCSDVACCTTLQQSGPTSTFGTSGDGLNVITSNAEANAVFAVPAICKVIISATNGCGGPGGWIGCANIGLPRNMILVETAPACVWGHEFGHTAGLFHDDSCGDLIMHSSNFNVDAVRVSECNAFRSNPSSSGPACSGSSGPSNDDCSNAVLVSDGVVAFVTTGATPSGIMATGLPPYAAGQPNRACQDFNGQPNNLFNDVWYLWTAGLTDSYTISSCGAASYDTKLAIYGATCGSAAISCNDDGPDPPCTGFSSELLVAGITGGQNYLIQVGGFGAADTGTGLLTIAPDNPVVYPNTCSTATNIGDGVHAFDTGPATASGVMATGLPPYAPNTPNTSCQTFTNGQPNNLNRDTWRRWTPGAGGDYTLSTCNDANYDTKLAIYGSACGSAAIACNDDGTGCAGFTSTMLVSGIVAGQEYTVQIGGFGPSDAGIGDLTLSPNNTTPPPSNYCSTSPNSIGAGAIMGSFGSTSISANDLTLTVAGASFNQFGLFYYGPAQTSLAFGEGLRCVAGSTSRLNPPIMTDFLGTANRALDYNQSPANIGPGLITPGARFNFQFWYRDPAGGPSGFNLSDGRNITFAP